MSFDSLKVLSGQKIASIHTIFLDRCKHTTVQSTVDGAINISSSLNAGVVGAITISGGTATSFTNSDPYLLWDDEIIKVTVDSDIQLTVVSRGHFGTVDASHSPSTGDIKHSGEVDGSCYGFPQTCSTSDSYDKDEKMLFTFTDTQLDWSKKFYNGFRNWSHTPQRLIQVNLWVVELNTPYLLRTLKIMILMSLILTEERQTELYLQNYLLEILILKVDLFLL